MIKRGKEVIKLVDGWIILVRLQSAEIWFGFEFGVSPVEKVY